MTKLIIPPDAPQEELARFRAMLNEEGLRQEGAQFEGGLLEYIEYVWPVVEPATPFVKGWAVEAICEHLEAVTAGEIKRLLINVPPGFTKSLITDVFWPTWEWGPCNLPHHRFVCASYAQYLTIRDNMRARNIIVSDRYQKYWKNRFQLSDEQATKIKFANDKTGWKFATSVGGTTGGERGNRFIIDDPNDPQEMESSDVRKSTNHWFLEVVPDRLNNITKDAIIIIQQRLHEDDVSGVALSHGLGYEHLMIPMEYDCTRHCVTVLGWEDPRGVIPQSDSVAYSDNDAAIYQEAQDGTIAWPERFPPDAIEILKLKGEYAWAGQYQQAPVPRGGGILKRDWWKEYPLKTDLRLPPLEFVIACLDTAYTEKEENDPSAMTVWGAFRDDSNQTKFMLLDAWRKRHTIHGSHDARRPGELMENYFRRTGADWGLVEWVAYTCEKWKVDRLLIENKAAGISVAQEMRRLYQMMPWAVELVDPGRQDKVARAYSVQHLFAEGLVYIPRLNGVPRDWGQMVLDEVATFPRASHDDLTDTVVMALRWFRDNNMALRREEIQDAMDEMLRFKRKPEPLYPV